MKIAAALEGFFYKKNRGLRFVFFNSIILFSATIVIFSLTLMMKKDPAPFALGLIFIIYAFYTLGKEGGLSFSFIYILLTVILLVPGGLAQKMPFLYIALLAFALTVYFTGFIDSLDERERKNFLIDGEIEGEMVDAIKKLNNAKNAISMRQGQLENYRILNRVIEGLISTLDPKQIVSVITSYTSKMIGDKPVQTTLLIKNEESDTFYPAVEEQQQTVEPLIKGAVSIYKKDPFDEWIIKNKFTLVIKNIETDIRFKNLRRDWIGFKSLIAMPLVENNRIIGILKFFSDVPEVFDSEDARLLNYLSDFCAAAVENSILYQKKTELATRDGLTGLFIRRYFIERLDEEIKRSKQSDAPFSYIMVDIDHFKDCNDTHGHLFGDKVLRLLGEFLKENLRDVDIIGRYGGEEFAVILPNTAANGAQFVAERIRKDFERLVITVDDHTGIRLTLSMGIVEYNKALKLVEVINMADKALYHSKETGRNKVTMWEDIA